MNQQGDRHNFGKFVTLENSVVSKPRNVMWEKMFLSTNSNVRILINQICKTQNVVSPFLIAPDLVFHNSEKHNGVVELLKVGELTRKLSSREIEAIGSMIGLCYWFGIGDLHHENISVGVNSGNSLVCFPIDIETVFEKMTHVRQTLLTPSSKISASNCGLSKILPQLISASNEDKVSFLISFVSVINLLNLNSENILAEVLKTEQINTFPVRMILRDTRTYSEYLKGNSQIPELDKSEIEQLAREDIPYFFRYLNGDAIQYFVNANHQIQLIENDRSKFDLMSSVVLTESAQTDLLKTNTTILSLSYLAGLLGYKATNNSLTNCSIDLECISLKFSITEDRIDYAYF